ncbi:MAG: RNA-binding S4 domain-containing protein [Paracoccaceae bacterium]
MPDAPEKAQGKIRVDKWLWYARFFKSRSLAGEAVASLRVNGEPVDKPSQNVRPGDVLTFAKEDYIRIIQIDAIGTRRGPASEAQELYTDLDPPQPKTRDAVADLGEREAGTGRPTKRERREIDALRNRDP